MPGARVMLHVASESESPARYSAGTPSAAAAPCSAKARRGSAAAGSLGARRAPTRARRTREAQPRPTAARRPCPLLRAMLCAVAPHAMLHATRGCMLWTCGMHKSRSRMVTEHCEPTSAVPRWSQCADRPPWTVFGWLYSAIRVDCHGLSAGGLRFGISASKDCASACMVCVGRYAL